ncbi:competence damage-inducible protein A [Bombiscardovia nodaiensis]|uniref:Competence damage-inducible protein A n=1 Tax=Bombiscardovia nodaiensis TaxID=2932181 RepID=A0ABN6SAM1_9BIFI|nr:competence damage-inducible protein A [Bombiscardovia nodaiensis]
MDDDVVERCDGLARMILAACGRQGLYIAASESLTGGLLADAFVRIPGASQVFLGSAVTYDSGAKAAILGVDEQLLQTYGAVHPQVAEQMALGTARLYGQAGHAGKVIGLSTTGVAGPGPEHGQPAGLVYIGFALPAGMVSNISQSDPSAGAPGVGSQQLNLLGSRQAVRRSAVLQVLRRLLHILQDNDAR